jgi:hypothetical protein
LLWRKLLAFYCYLAEQNVCGHTILLILSRQ